MAILDMRQATFCRGRAVLLDHITIALDAGERADLTCETNLAASIAARLAAGIIKCSSGVVFVASFDPKIQPVQTKRLVGFVAYQRMLELPAAREYFAYRAALWELDRDRALRRGTELLQRFRDLPPAQALALAGALLHRPRLLVLDRPSERMRAAAAAAAHDAALFAAYGPADRMARATFVPVEMAGSTL